MKKQIKFKNIKLIYLFLFIGFILLNLTINLNAEEDYMFEGNELEYTRACFLYNKESTKSEEECKAFETYLQNKQHKYEDELSDINSEKEDVQNNILEYVKKIESYQKEIDIIDAQIALLESEGADEINSIENLTEDIKEKIKLYEEQYELLKEKLLETQVYLGTNYKLNFLLKADSFLDYEVRKEQLATIYKYDIEKLNEVYKDLEDIDLEKGKFTETTEKIEKQKQLLSDSKSLSAELREQSKQILIIYKQQEAEILARYTEKVEDVDGVKKMLEKNKAKLENLKPSNGWISPIAKGSYEISAGVWNYPESFGGGLHLGVDLAAVNGTEVVAPANGIVLFSSNGCAKNGYLGSLCGAPGAAGGGNQVYMLVSLDNKLFAISFAHLEYNSVAETGTVVLAGDVIGRVGSTGNSTGNHTHLEMHYLGENIDIKTYVDNWNGDLSFGNGWGEAGLNNICKKTLDKNPCRIDAAAVMGL